MNKVNSILFSVVTLVALLISAQSSNAQVATEGLIIDDTATRLNPNAGEPIYTFALHNLEFNPSGKVVAAGQGTGNVIIWDLESKEIKHQFKAHEDWAFSTRFSKDGKQLLTGGGDNKVKLWSLDSLEQPLSEFERHTGDVHSVLFTSDENMILSGGDDMAPVLENLKAKTYTVFEKHPRQIPAMALSPDGKSLATASRDGKVRIFSMPEGELLTTLDAHEKDCMSVRFVPGTNYIVTGGYDNTVAIWSYGMGYLVHRYKKQEGAVVCVDVSPDGKSVASVDHKSIAVNSIEKPTNETQYFSPNLASDEQLSFVRYHPDGTELFASTTLGRILIVDTQNLKLKDTLSVPKPKSKTKKEEE